VCRNAMHGGKCDRRVPHELSSPVHDSSNGAPRSAGVYWSITTTLVLEVARRSRYVAGSVAEGHALLGLVPCALSKKEMQVR